VMQECCAVLCCIMGSVHMSALRRGGRVEVCGSGSPCSDAYFLGPPTRTRSFTKEQNRTVPSRLDAGGRTESAVRGSATDCKEAASGRESCLYHSAWSCCGSHGLSSLASVCNEDEREPHPSFLQ
jgi:hypothetical protein